MRFNNSGKLVCAVSNDGSLNAWLYPTERRPDEVIEPEAGKTDTDDVKTEAPQTPLTAAEADGAEGKIRAASTREATPEEKEGGREGDGEGAEPVEGEADAAEAEGEAASAALVLEGTDAGPQNEGSDAVAEVQVQKEVEEEEEEMIEAVADPEAEAAAAATNAPDAAVGHDAPQDVEMGNAAAGDEVANGEPGGDVEMAEVSAAEQEATPQPPPSAAPTRPASRAPSPNAKDRRAAASPRPPPIAVPTPGEVAVPSAPAAEVRRAQQEAEARKRQLKRFRQAICHSASLLSLSFCPTGRWVSAVRPFGALTG